MFRLIIFNSTKCVVATLFLDLSCPGPNDQSTQCIGEKSFEKVRSECEGRSKCTVEASNKVFGDPCSGIYKYLNVTHCCKRRGNTLCCLLVRQ